MSLTHTKEYKCLIALAPQAPVGVLKICALTLASGDRLAIRTLAETLQEEVDLTAQGIAALMTLRDAMLRGIGAPPGTIISALAPFNGEGG